MEINPAEDWHSLTDHYRTMLDGELEELADSIDDLTETAGTLTAAAKMVKEHGARRVLAAVSHSLFNELAHKRLQGSAIDELITTNSTVVHPVPNFKLTVLSIAELLGEAIKRIHGGESVSSLFEINGRGNKD